VDVLRKPQFREESAEIPLAASFAPEVPPHRIADAEKAKRLMGQLPADQKQVLEMAFLDGLTHVEIAARTGEPLGTIKSRIRLGLMFLRKELAT
jgi:RNA polymerase sigma-70 factor (ECF subfamily)